LIIGSDYLARLVIPLSMNSALLITGNDYFARLVILLSMESALLIAGNDYLPDRYPSLLELHPVDNRQ
jgi:hypothetical protein